MFKSRIWIFHDLMAAIGLQIFAAGPDIYYKRTNIVFVAQTLAYLCTILSPQNSIFPLWC